ncbi:hypothetical protein NUACC21_59940 [Scytonema sp. NUACC21]
MLPILLVEDSQVDRALIIYELKREFSDLQIESVIDAESFYQALKRGNFSLLITDYRLRWSDGLTVLREFKSHYPYCPTIMFTDSGSEEIAVEAMKAGLDDYIIKSPKHYVRLSVAVRSILQRVESEQRANRLETRLQGLLNQLNVGVFRSTLNGYFLEGNSAFLNLLGVKSLQEAQNMELPKEIRFPSLLEIQGANSSREVELRRADGLVIWVSLCQIINVTQPEPVVEGLLEDISDRKQLLHREQVCRAIAEAQEQRSSFLAQASSILVSSLDYRTTLASVADLAIPTLADWCFIDIIEENVKPFSQPVVAAVDPQKKALVLELKRRYPTPVDADYGPPKVLRTGKPELVSHIPESIIFSIARDEEHLSLLRQLQAKSYMVVPLIVRDRKLGTIAFSSAQPGRHYTQADLEMALELADLAALAIDNARLYRESCEANRIKDEFLAIVSHELRTPLHSILGWANMLRHKKLSEATTAQALETIERNAQLQRKLIDDILDVSRIVQGKIRLNLNPVHLVSIINSAVADIRPSAEVKAIRVETILDSCVSKVIGDSDRLQQIVWNLLANAVKFTPQGGRVEVRLEQVNSSARIVVSDTGQGISTDFLPYVFERFRQGNAKTTRAQGGLGLGLAIVHHLVEMHGGTVYAASEGEGRGATFTVQLPLEKEQPMRSLEQKPVGLNEFPSLKGLQILIVDDDADALQLTAFILEQCQVKVTKTTSAREALDRFSQLQPDILISDIGMPYEDGYWLIRQIRSLETHHKQQIPAIALTAYAKEEEQIRTLEAGFQMHLPKPVNPAELVSVVARLAQGNFD